MKKYLLIIFLLCIPISAGAWGIGLIGGGTVAEEPAGCALGSDDFEGYSDGDNIAAQAGWSGEDADTFEVDNAQAADSSTNSLFVNVVSSGSARAEYDAMTDQSSGSFNVSFWIRIDYEGDSTEIYPFEIRDASNNAAVSLKFVGGGAGTATLYYGVGSSYIESESDLSIDTWYKIEIEVDTTNTNQSIAIGGSQILEDAAFYEGVGALTKLSFSNYSNDVSMDFWVDEICVESGDYAY